MRRFARLCRALGLSIEQGARLWAAGVRRPGAFVARAGEVQGRSLLLPCLEVGEERFAALLDRAKALGVGPVPAEPTRGARTARGARSSRGAGREGEAA